MHDFLADLDSVDALPITPEETAKYAGLRYVSHDDLTFKRRKWGRGFTYLDADGDHITDEAERNRIEAIVIPPAWTEVCIAPFDNAHILAVGRDEAGRKQYRYHEKWHHVRNLTKFNLLMQFGDCLPTIREVTDEHLRRRKLDREKVLAIVVRLLEDSLIRIGNDAYARDNESYGLTTMQEDHVDANSRRVIFRFMGKSGKEHEIDVEDRRLARAIDRLMGLGGERLFEFYGDDDELHAVRSADVNAYLREHTGEDFTAKEFRTWGGSTYTIQLLGALDPPEDEKAADHEITQAVKQAAEHMGNTPAVARKYYIHPIIFEAYRDGSLPDVLADQKDAKSTYDLDRYERTLMQLIADLYA